MLVNAMFSFITWLYYAKTLCDTARFDGSPVHGHLGRLSEAILLF